MHLAAAAIHAAPRQPAILAHQRAVQAVMIVAVAQTVQHAAVAVQTVISVITVKLGSHNVTKAQMNT